MINRLRWVPIYIGMILLSFGCSIRESALESALRQAGGNRAELEKVLEHYRTSDGEKYRAACFLIENMPYQSGYEENGEWRRYLRYFSGFSSFDRSRPAQEFVDSMARADGSFSPAALTRRGDLQTVDSAFLTAHIEWAFKVRREQPWGRHIPWRDFCEYLLPYRVGDEPLSLWREKLYRQYNPLLDSLRRSAQADNLQAAAQLLLDTLRKETYRYTSLLPEGPHVGPALLQWKAGSCRELADMLMYVMRSVGIPCGTDRMMQRGDANASHFWNFIRDRQGNTLITEFPDKNRWMPAPEFDIPRGKVYRTDYSPQPAAIQGEDVPEHLHPAFRTPFFHDVTAEYAATDSRTVVLEAGRLYGVAEGEPVYLCLSSWMSWKPVACARCRGGSVRFGDVKPGVMALAATWDGRTLRPASCPFALDEEGDTIRYLQPKKGTEEVTVYRKYRLYIRRYLEERMIGGTIEGSNRPDFAEADTLYLIREAPYRLYTTVPLKSDRPYRYVRYRGGKGSNCNIAELALYGEPEDTLPLRGTVIGTPGAYGNDESHSFRTVFDGNTETSFDYHAQEGGWAGMNLGHPRRVRKAVYTPRNDVNFIYRGNEYELFYWADDCWQSAGRQKATGDSLRYTVPHNALLYLKNHTTGKEERIFECRDGRQKFW